MANLLAVGTTDADSATFTVAAGASATLSLAIAASGILPDGVMVDIQKLTSAGGYITFSSMTKMHPAEVLTAVGTFKVHRYPCIPAVGVDID